MECAACPVPDPNEPMSMPDFAAILFLGDRSPYGLSVASALLRPDSLHHALRVGRIVTPSADAYDRLAVRRANARLRGRGMAARAGRWLRRRVASAATLSAVMEIEDEGQPLPDSTLDPGVTTGELERLCAAQGIGWQRVDGVRSILVAETLKAMRPDLLLSAAFPLILPEALLSIPGQGAINFHPSLLPRCRGCHPIFWTLASGETQGGVTAHRMTTEVDAGDIVAQIPLPLSDQDDYVSLYRRAMGASARLVSMVNDFLTSPGRHAIPQDASRATRFGEDTDEDHRVHWSGRSPAEIAALVRTGMAFTTLRGERLGILSVVEHRPAHRERRTARAGRVAAVHEDILVVAAAGGAIGVRTVSWRGRVHQAGDLARALGVMRNEVLG